MTSTAEALYLRDGQGFVANSCTGSAWDPMAQSGGAVLALLGHVLEGLPTLVPMSLTRLTVDIVRPVPVGRHLQVDGEILREGKKIQLVDLVIRDGDTVTTRARALRIRDREVTGLPFLPGSSSPVSPAAGLPDPESLAPLDLKPGVAEFLRSGAEIRRTTGPVNGAHAVWCRLRVPVVAGEPVRATSLAVLPLDIGNLIGVLSFDPSKVTSINPDVSGHLCRAPVGEWVALTGNTYYDHEVAHGVSMAVMSDAEGVFGVTSTSQVLDPR